MRERPASTVSPADRARLAGGTVISEYQVNRLLRLTDCAEFPLLDLPPDLSPKNGRETLFGDQVWAGSEQVDEADRTRDVGSVESMC